MSPDAQAYRDLTKRMLEARASGDEALEEVLLDELDAVWWRLAASEIAEIAGPQSLESPEPKR